MDRDNGIPRATIPHMAATVLAVGFFGGIFGGAIYGAPSALFQLSQGVSTDTLQNDAEYRLRTLLFRMEENVLYATAFPLVAGRTMAEDMVGEECRKQRVICRPHKFG